MQLALLSLLALLACKERPPETGMDVSSERPAPVRVVRAEPTTTGGADPVEAAPKARADAPPAPASVAAIRPLLQARHADDLPSRAVLEGHPDPEAALRWMAEHDELMLMRARSLDLLGLWDTDDNAAFLVAVASDGDRHLKQRTAAVLGLKRTELAARPAAVAALGELAGSGDDRVAVEAIGALGSVASARPTLEALAAREGLGPTVAAALEQALR